MMNCIHLSLSLDMGENVRKRLSLYIAPKPPQQLKKNSKKLRVFRRHIGSFLQTSEVGYCLTTINPVYFFQSRTRRTNFFLTSHAQTPTSWWLKKPSCYYR